MFLSGAFYGIYRSGSLKEDLMVCTEIGELFRRTKISISFRGLNVYELAAELKTGAELPHLSFISSLPESSGECRDFRAEWSRLVSAEKSIQPEEKKLLLDFGAFLGRSDTEGQISSITALEHELCALEERRTEEYRHKGRLWRSLGLLVGAMIGIIVI